MGAQTILHALTELFMRDPAGGCRTGHGSPAAMRTGTEPELVATPLDNIGQSPHAPRNQTPDTLGQIDRALSMNVEAFSEVFFQGHIVVTDLNGINHDGIAVEAVGHIGDNPKRPHHHFLAAFPSEIPDGLHVMKHDPKMVFVVGLKFQEVVSTTKRSELMHELA